VLLQLNFPVFLRESARAAAPRTKAVATRTPTNAIAIANFAAIANLSRGGRVKGIVYKYAFCQCLNIPVGPDQCQTNRAHNKRSNRHRMHPRHQRGEYHGSSNCVDAACSCHRRSCTGTKGTCSLRQGGSLAKVGQICKGNLHFVLVLHTSATAAALSRSRSRPRSRSRSLLFLGDTFTLAAPILDMMGDVYRMMV
jgi:hypothetical protein